MEQVEVEEVVMVKSEWNRYQWWWCRKTAGGSGVVIRVRYPAGSWRSGDNSSATVDASGNVTGVAGGTVTIYYDVIAGSCTTSVSKSITVTPTASAGTVTAGTTPSYWHNFNLYSCIGCIERGTGA
ncbi:MAG: hypothetical protein U0T32_07375 [Chitinophagales bacterium]